VARAPAAPGECGSITLGGGAAKVAAAALCLEKKLKREGWVHPPLDVMGEMKREE
jgi:hypothetical protein